MTTTISDNGHEDQDDIGEGQEGAHQSLQNHLRTENAESPIPFHNFESFALPDLVHTWYHSFYEDYMAYIRTAEEDAILSAKLASLGSQVTIGFMAAVLDVIMRRNSRPLSKGSPSKNIWARPSDTFSINTTSRTIPSG